MKNILDGKYIKTNRNNSKIVINFLYNLGYRWDSGYENVNDKYFLYDKYNDYDEVIYIYLHNNVLNYAYTFAYMEYYNPNSEELDAQILYREVKLKRILKSK